MKIQAQVHLAPICLVIGLVLSQFPTYYFPHLLFPWISRSPLRLYMLEEVKCGAKCLLLYLPCLVVPGKCKLAAYSERETSHSPHDIIILGPFAYGRKQTHTGKALKIWLPFPANFLRVMGKCIYFYNGKFYPRQ